MCSPGRPKGTSKNGFVRLCGKPAPNRPRNRARLALARSMGRRTRARRALINTRSPSLYEKAGQTNMGNSQTWFPPARVVLGRRPFLAKRGLALWRCAFSKRLFFMILNRLWKIGAADTTSAFVVLGLVAWWLSGPLWKPFWPKVGSSQREFAGVRVVVCGG
jgi:hypothetical protein